MKYQKTTAVIDCKVDNQTVLLHPLNGKVIVLNESGTCLWDILNDALPIDSIISKFTAVYQAAPNSTTCRSDIQTFLSELTQKGLLNELES